MKISIITLSYNNLEMATKPYIESLYKYTKENDFELIWIENGSTDGTAEYLKELENRHGNLKVVYNSENLGYSKGNNQGLKYVSNNLIGFLNNDILFTPDWLDCFLEVFENNEIDMASPYVNTWEDREINKNNYLEKYESHLATLKNSFDYCIKPDFSCAILRKNLVEEVGCFDEAFTPAYYEDDDLCMRALYKGFKLAVINTAFVYHNHSTTGRKLPKIEEIKKRNCQYFYNKHILGKMVKEYEKIYFELKDYKIRMEKINKHPIKYMFKVLKSYLKS